MLTSDGYISTTFMSRAARCRGQLVLICQKPSNAVVKGYAHVGIDCSRLTFQGRVLNEEPRVDSLEEDVLRLKVVS